MDTLDSSVVFKGNQGQRPDDKGGKSGKSADAGAGTIRSISDLIAPLTGATSYSGAASDGEDHWSGH